MSRPALLPGTVRGWVRVQGVGLGLSCAAVPLAIVYSPLLRASPLSRHGNFTHASPMPLASAAASQLHQHSPAFGSRRSLSLVEHHRVPVASSSVVSSHPVDVPAIHFGRLVFGVDHAHLGALSGWVAARRQGGGGGGGWGRWELKEDGLQGLMAKTAEFNQVREQGGSVTAPCLVSPCTVISNIVEVPPQLRETVPCTPSPVAHPHPDSPVPC